MERDTFIFYRSYFEAINDLPEEDQLQLYKAIANYALNFKEPKLSGLSNTIWKLICPIIKNHNKNYVNGCGGGKHGKKGGRPKKEKPPTKPPTKPPKNPEETPNKTGNKDKDKDKDTNKYIVPQYIEMFNNITSRSFKTLNDKAKRQLLARIKQGYTSDDLKKAIKAAYSDEYHKSQDFKHLTPEFFTRQDKLDKWMNTEAQEQYNPFKHNL